MNKNKLLVSVKLSFLFYWRNILIFLLYQVLPFWFYKAQLKTLSKPSNSVKQFVTVELHMKVELLEGVYFRDGFQFHAHELHFKVNHQLMPFPPNLSVLILQHILNIAEGISLLETLILYKAKTGYMQISVTRQLLMSS